MLVKFESKSNRVKGVSFHPKRPWVLASLHNGSVQLWDYRMGTLVDKFEEHEGPVRGVSFHATQPLFVSGGDDYKIKVWNYKLRKCIFTLTGHLDYIRTVFFHHEYPWIISASDDQTVRIWNWQSRTCISVLTGHNHYVMCAQFHPKEDLVVSASLDQTVRVWDFSGLRKKNTNAPSTRVQEDIRPTFQNQTADMFGNTDVLVKYVLEGHDRGVNWASFHHTLPLIVSGADDRQVKLWRMSDTKAWEVDTCRGHYNNVSCALFHPRQDLILSNSEDKTIRIWDMNKRTGVHNFRRENDRFWMLTAHPERNLFAAGHDNGLIVFKFERERPAFIVHEESLFYVKDKFIRHYDFATGEDTSVIGIRKSPGLNNQPRSMSFNVAESTIVLSSLAENGIHEIYQIPREISHTMLDGPDKSNECKRGVGQTAVFVARNRYAVFNRANQTIDVRNLNNDSSKTIQLSMNAVEIFQAGTGKILIASPTSIFLYDVQEQVSLAETPATAVKYVHWNQDGSMAALVARHNIIITNKKLEPLCNIHETIRMKGGIWDDSGIFIYSTLNHIKYALANGDNGIIRTVDEPMYLTRSSGNRLFCLDREGKNQIITIDPTEFRFKQALNRHRYDEVMHIIQNSNLVGQSIISYLTKKGYSEVALQFVREPRSRFDLALECGDMDIAVDMAKTIDEEDCWMLLSDVAIKQGHPDIAELALQRVKNFDKLSFLYVITGQDQKLSKMAKIAEMRNDPMSQFHNSLYTGDVEEQIKVLRTSGLSLLAHSLSIKHGLLDLAKEIATEAGMIDAKHSSVINQGSLLIPLTPVHTETSCKRPSIPVSRGFFDSIQSNSQVPLKDTPLTSIESAENEEDPVPNGKSDPSEAQWGIETDLDIEIPTESVVDQADNQSAAPSLGPSFHEFWGRNSAIVSDQIAAGAFDNAIQLLNKQVGIVNCDPLRQHFISIFQGSRIVSLQYSVVSQPQILPICRNWDQGNVKKLLPTIVIGLHNLEELAKLAYDATTAGQFTEAIVIFRRLLEQALVSGCSTTEEVNRVKTLIATSREYITGLSMEIARRLETDAKRVVELAAYFTHCRLQPTHLILSLQVAMTQSYKNKCLHSASVFARRLLDMNPQEQIANKARQVQVAGENVMRDDLELDYNPLSSFVVCAETFKPLYGDMEVTSCPYCEAKYQVQSKGSICKVCLVAEVGKSSGGLKLL